MPFRVEPGVSKIVVQSPTPLEKLSTKKWSSHRNISDTYSCEETQKDEKQTSTTNPVTNLPRSISVYPERDMIARVLAERQLTRHVKYCKYIHVDISFLDVFLQKTSQLQETTDCEFYVYSQKMWFPGQRQL